MVSSAPVSEPSTWNWTPATATLSEALAETVMVPETVEPELGAVTDTVGGVVSVEGGGEGGGVLRTEPPQALRPIARNNRRQVELMPDLPAPGFWKGLLTVFRCPLLRSSHSLCLPTENSVPRNLRTTVRGGQFENTSCPCTGIPFGQLSSDFFSPQAREKL